MSHPVYLVSGEPFLADEALERIRAETEADPLGEEAFGPDVDPAELLGALETPSLLGGKRLVVLRDAQSLKKDGLDALSAYLESPAPHTVLVIVSSGRTKLDAAVKKVGAVVALEPPKGRKLVGWVRERARAVNLNIDERGASALVAAVGADLRELSGALDQLLTAAGPGTRVGAAHVARVFQRVADERMYVLTDAVGERRLGAAMVALRKLLEQGDEPVVLFGALSAHVRRLLAIRRHADGPTAQVAAMLGMPEWRAQRFARQALAYSEDELAAALENLAAADRELKTGDLPPETALEKVVVEVVGR